MAYSLDYQLNHDLDIFLKLSNHLIHIATAGAKLPEELASLDEMIINNKSLVFNINDQVEITINPYLDELLQFQTTREKDLYLTDFKRISSKGIITFDKTIVEDCNDPFYHVVAWPSFGDFFDVNKILLPIETPDFISRRIEENIAHNIEDSNRSGKEFDKFELLKNI